MKRLPLLLMLLPALAWAQVPSVSSSPTSTRGATTVAAPPAAARPVATPAQPAAPAQVLPVPAAPPVPATLPRSSGPISSQGPAQIAPPPASTAPAKVYDRDGRILPGVRPAGPGRVFDSNTGRYYDAPPGQGR